MAHMPFAALHVCQSWETRLPSFQSMFFPCVSRPESNHCRYLDVQGIVRWLSARQKAPDSGFAGRANKLVDGCYSHWVGGCWSLLAAALGSDSSQNQNLWSREALARYILCCAQELRKEGEKPTSRKGGFKDKPGKAVDAYHSHYNLAGLGAAQFVAEYDRLESNTLPLTEAYNWKITGGAQGPWEEDDLIKPVHPVFVVQVDKALACRRHFEEHVDF
jgi:protein farnesyltransferase subunit beta